MDTVKEYRVKVSVRNNLILRAIEDAGYASVAEFCRATDVGLHMSQMNDLIAFRTKPINNDGRFRPIAIAIMEALGAAPTDLWTVEQLNLKLTKNSALAYIAQDDIRGYLGMREEEVTAIENPEQVVFNKERADVVRGMFHFLTPREANVLQLRFGLVENQRQHTLGEIGDMMDVGRERVRQIEARALRKLRHSCVTDKLRKAEVI